LRALQETANPRDRARPRLAAIAKVEDKPWVAHRLASEAGGGKIAISEELFNFSQ